LINEWIIGKSSKNYKQPEHLSKNQD